MLFKLKQRRWNACNARGHADGYRGLLMELVQAVLCKKDVGLMCCPAKPNGWLRPVRSAQGLNQDWTVFHIPFKTQIG